LAELTATQYAELIRKLDEVCRQAQELAAHIRGKMVDRARQDRQVLSKGTTERRHAPKKRR
jgi:hypothetical protein